ncbi:AraC family transcriptional regulator of adaptative response/methylated-DNA-[protein]-cysteine methyltransferase [Sphingomonas leidyi]|uniref:AraC family transcriptional regulator of adaptative response/methylated-DNA-[protein]-cysteine methyltransferase n=1 Tax=Sphingomonas leidyi TaxID=68569 RepID=A0A7X5ZUN9_9SPHN|nr:methylated-DNA--[protein]-cysteine S-methyltransferase [Sphingomonas leidyi]NIJ64245.1 AraC family transcriptional regulator of adaptative response/methylated-DNA-[protein]-cysteine methyltransferase [Sphingomonas leidyi]
MPERIDYSIGSSSLGEFVAARSGKGLSVFEFIDSPPDAERLLVDRLGDVELVRDDVRMADLVASLAKSVDYPMTGGDIELDLRGSDYQKRVWELLREIPVGRTTSYGALAEKLGTRDARDVTEAIASNGIAILVPCHRVVKKDGSLSGFAGAYGASGPCSSASNTRFRSRPSSRIDFSPRAIELLRRQLHLSKMRGGEGLCRLRSISHISTRSRQA